jgi:hypothetical protein
MLDWLRRRLTYGNVMATIAVFGVLAGGGAYAASKIGAGDIAKNAVRSKHIKKNAVKTPKIANGAVTAPKLADGLQGQGHYTSKRAGVTLAADGSNTPIVTLEALPAGTYLITGHTAAVNPPNTDLVYVRCGIKGAGKDSFGESFIGSAASVDGETLWDVSQIFVSLPVTSAEPFTAEFFCRRDGTSTAYVEETRLTAIAVGAITESGDP